MAKRKEKPDMQLFQTCIDDAREIIRGEKMMDMQSHVLSIASALFRVRTTAGGEPGSRPDGGALPPPTTKRVREVASRPRRGTQR